GLARYLELPATGWSRKYRVRVHGTVDEARLAALKNGITVEGVHYKSIDAVLEKQENQKRTGTANSWLSIGLREGKNREIRRVMEALGLRVNRLIRVSYGPFSLGKLPVGGVEEIKTKIMKDQIKGYFTKEEK
ncbi:MAG: rRNA pseudouridine synthase, partial [Alphaproteobacteria bacterium]|nr:rRNA pseudouridine synthase [Alphaproteobacteria bacterium]